MFSIEFFLSEESNEVKKSLKTIDFNESKLTISSDIFKDLSKTLKSDVKCFYKSKEFEFLVINDFKVFVFGHDADGRLGLGNVNYCLNLTEITDLSGNQIEEFYEGNNCMFAKSETNCVYSWGKNHHGQLGRGTIDSFFQDMKPKKCDFLSNKNIIEIICGFDYCLALSSDGKVYGWGCNDMGQVGYGEDREEVLIPILIDFEVPVKYFGCNQKFSFVVDINGNAFYWGQTSKTIQWKPKRMLTT